MACYGTALYGSQLYAEHVPSTIDEIIDGLNPWELEPGDLEITLPDGTEIQWPAVPDAPYRLEVRTGTGGYRQTLTQWSNARFEQVLSAGNTLTFTVPFDDEAEVKPPYQVWLRDDRGLVVERFKIRGRKPRQTLSGATYLNVTAQSGLCQLAMEPVMEFEKTPDDELNVREVVSELLGGQAQDSPVKLGSIDASIGSQDCAVSVQDGTILSALIQIQQGLDKDDRGTFYVDAQWRLNWKRHVGYRTGQVLAVGGNIRGIERDENWDSMANRVYFFGAGDDPATRLNLQDAGETYLYIQDDDSVATYGVKPARKQDRRIRHEPPSRSARSAPRCPAVLRPLHAC